MDPDVALVDLREARKSFEETGLYEDAVQLANCVQALDEWMTKGGFLPKDWAMVSRARVYWDATKQEGD
jgi:hypothetical protein